jgi:protein-L-isoaspartate(D-aspartate) O-methyltransferase
MSRESGRRRFFAEEIQAICNLQTAVLVEALATVPRERFLPSGPWLIRSESDFGGPSRQTPDGDPRHVYHNLAIAIDASRQLFNGAPGLLALCIDRLALRPGQHVLHVGCGLGYYSALIAHCVGPAGRVVAIDVDQALAAAARTNLKPFAWVDVRPGDGTDLAGESFDAILVNAGVTHPHEAWLDALRPDGRLMLPLTCTMAAMGPIGKGIFLGLSRRGDVFEAQTVTMVAIYSALGIRDPDLNAQLGKAFARAPFPGIKRLRRDDHEASARCWFHTGRFCLSTDDGIRGYRATKAWQRRNVMSA